ncbi:MAG: hypothetical protein ACJ790_06890 [Myxococcaceae bacterium]
MKALPRLDTLRSHLYKARPLAAVVVLLASGWAAADVVNGAQLPDNASKVGENRYRSDRDWAQTEKYYHGVYPESAFPRRMIVHQPGVKAIHIVNPSGKNFEGLNIYEANDEVRIYVVPVGSVKAARKTKPEAKPKATK